MFDHVDHLFHSSMLGFICKSICIGESNSLSVSNTLSLGEQEQRNAAYSLAMCWYQVIDMDLLRVGDACYPIM